MRLCPRCSALIAGREWACAGCGWSAEIRKGIPLLAPDAEGADRAFDPGQFAVLFDLEGGNFWFRSRNALIKWALGTYFPRARSMLELGCGTGFVASGIERDFPELALVASELYSSGAEFAKCRMQRAEVVQMDGRRITFQDEFDVAGAFDVIEHIEEDEQVLAQLHKCLRAHGGLLITVPQHRWLWSGVDAFAHHQRRYMRRELVGKVGRAGFRVRRCTSFVSLLLPAIFLSRLRVKDSQRVDPLAEFRLPQAANAALELIMRFERLMIRAGLSFPAGGSLLLVAEKI